MKTIDINDTIFATVTANGMTLVNLRLSGLNSMGEVLSSVHRALPGAAGMMTLTLRNGSQGWTDRRAFVIR